SSVVARTLPLRSVISAWLGTGALTTRKRPMCDCAAPPSKRAISATRRPTTAKTRANNTAVTRSRLRQASRACIAGPSGTIATQGGGLKWRGRHGLSSRYGVATISGSLPPGRSIRRAIWDVAAALPVFLQFLAESVWLARGCAPGFPARRERLMIPALQPRPASPGLQLRSALRVGILHSPAQARRRGMDQPEAAAGGEAGC